MPLFIYEALEPNTGKRIREEAEFPSALELFRWLRHQGLILIKYKPKRRPLWEKILPSRISRRELAEFCRNLAFMIKGGVPVLQALADLEKASENRTLARAIRKLRLDVERGRPFSEGMAAAGKVFSPIVQALTLVGEETGKLPETLEAAAEHLLRVDEIISNTKRALIYPSFLLATMGIAMAFWIFFVLPRILSLFKEMGTSLPLPTVLLMTFVNFCTSNWPYFLVPPFLIIGGILLIKRNKKCYLIWEKVMLKLPVIKKIKRYSDMAFFFEYTSLLLSAGVNLIQTLEIMQKSLRSPFMHQIIEVIKKRIEEGFTLTEACEGSRFFSPLELRMIKVGEETGRLIDQMKYLADYYYQGLERLVSSISKIIEPTLLIIVGVMFLIIALALIGPIYDLISRIGAV